MHMRGSFAASRRESSLLLKENPAAGGKVPAGGKSMIDLVREKLPEIVELCRRFHVQRLDVAGSAAKGGFREEDSDLDFVVQFNPLTPGGHADAYFALWFALEDMFGRTVDLIEFGAVKNPYLLESLVESKEELYAA
jgi:predicted nucleotidyltransferase